MGPEEQVQRPSPMHVLLQRDLHMLYCLEEQIIQTVYTDQLRRSSFTHLKQMSRSTALTGENHKICS